MAKWVVLLMVHSLNESTSQRREVTTVAGPREAGGVPPTPIHDNVRHPSADTSTNAPYLNLSQAPNKRVCVRKYQSPNNQN